MDDKIADLLAQYDVTLYRAGRVKGSWMLETDQGLLQLAGCSYSEGKAQFEQNLKEYIVAQEFPWVDLFVPTKNGSYLAQGPYNEMFLMRRWQYGEDCDAMSEEHVLRAVKMLGKLHMCMKGLELSEDEQKYCLQPELTGLLERKNKELRRIRSYIRAKKQKSIFEQKFLSRFEQQYVQAESAIAKLDKEMYGHCYLASIAGGEMCHGNFTHHSVRFLPDGEAFVTGFEHAETGMQIQDFYLLFRKIMEKWDWEERLGREMLSVYTKIRPVSEEEKKILQVLLLYPEKFWKVANGYYNNRKSWIPEKNMQKLLQTMEQAEKKEETIRGLFT